MRRVFVIQEHEDFGSAGLRPTWIPESDPLFGMAVPHDILEHSLWEPGPAEGELMALGAAVYVRAEGGYWNQKQSMHSPAQNIASDLPMVWGRVARGDHILRPFPHRSQSLSRYCYAEETIDEILHEFRRLDRAGERVYYPEDGHTELSAGHLDTMRHWLRNGYRLARRRYSSVADAYHMCQLFLKIEGVGSSTLRGYEEHLGVEVVFNISIRRGECTARLIEPDYDY